MEDKDIKKLKRYLEDVIEGRDDLLQTTEKLVTTASQQVLLTEKTSTHRVEVLKYLTKALILFSELNDSVSNFIKTEPLPKSADVQICKELHTQEPKQSQSPPILDLNDFFKDNMSQSMSSFHSSTSGPKLSHNEVVNDIIFKKPLDSTTLKAICLANANESACNSHNIVEEHLPKPSLLSVEDSTLNNQSLSNNFDVDTTGASLARSCTIKSVIQEHSETKAITSPSLSVISESEMHSTVSSTAYQHPLAKFQPPTNIPKQYDTQDMEKIKENLCYLNKKMGFDRDQLNQMQSQFSKDFHYEEPVREVQEVQESFQTEEVVIAGENNTGLTDTVTIDDSKNEVPEKLRDIKISDGTVVLNNQIIEAGPSTSTDAVRQHQLMKEDVIDSTASDSESCEKVSTWLKNNRLSGEKLKQDPTVSNILSKESKFKPNSAIEKLHNIKRFDRNEEAREQARNDMPDIKFVPVEVPSVIKNDLNPDSDIEKKDYIKKKKIKDVNKEFETYDIKTMEAPGIGAVCVFSHIESPSEFYLQILNDVSTARLDEISDDIHLQFRDTWSPFRCKRDAFEGLGKFCCGYVWENKEGWYRLQVIDWDLDCSSDDVEVKTVDYGFTCRTSYTTLRQMTKKLADIPMLAVQCHFPYLYPPGSTVSNILPEWPRTTIDNLYAIAKLDDSYTDYSDFKMFEITLAVLQGESLAVDLVPFSESEADSLRNLLLDFQLATEIIEDYGEHPELGTFLEDVDELEQPENLNEMVLAYDAKDEMRICRFTRKDGTCYKGKNCKLEHINLKDGYTTDKATVFYTAINVPILPAVGETVCVLVTSYIDSCTYLVQLVRKSVVKDNTNIMMDRDISDLIDVMNHPKKILKYEKFKVFPAIGEVILAYHSFSKMWMRVAVRDLRYDSNWNLTNLEVYAVDFGDQFTVKLTDTRVMLEDFMHIPFQVFQIYLDKYQHKIGCNLKKSKSFWDKHISYKNFMVHIKSSGAPFKVNLMTMRGREIGPTLVKEGFAEKRSMDICIVEGNKMDLY